MTSRATPPSHLQPKTREWYRRVCREYRLEDHHVRLLTAAAEAWDRYQAARSIIDQDGMTYEDRFGAPKMRPEVLIERDSRIAFMRALRELDLDVELPAAPVRPPGLRSNRS